MVGFRVQPATMSAVQKIARRYFYAATKGKIVMSKLLELAEENRNIIVAISLADLIECNEELIRRTKATLEQQVTDAAAETYPSAAKVAEMLDVNKTTLWRWAKLGYLVPIEVGGKRRYKMSDIKRILGTKSSS